MAIVDGSALSTLLLLCFNLDDTQNKRVVRRKCTGGVKKAFIYTSWFMARTTDIKPFKVLLLWFEVGLWRVVVQHGLVSWRLREYSAKFS